MKNTVAVGLQHSQISLHAHLENLPPDRVFSPVPSHVPGHMDQVLLSALSSGASNKHIALMLFKSEFTVRNRLSRIYKKINVANRAQAAVWYRNFAATRAGQTPQIGTSVPLRALDRQ